MDLLLCLFQISLLCVCIPADYIAQETPSCGIWGMPCPNGPCGGFTCGENSRCSEQQRCVCLPGYGRPCTDKATAIITCSDIDECALGTDRCPRTQSRCENSPGGYRCVPFCKPGYGNVGTGQIGAALVCRDINECLITTVRDSCGPLSRCENTLGSFRCTCRPGYTGSGGNCRDIDECRGATTCHVEATCINTDGSYTCRCNTGFSGDGRNCVLIRAAEDEDECQQEGLCHPDARCINTRGSYLCWCRPGYTGNGVDTCDDLDECQKFNPCHSDATCRNADGSFQCACDPGYIGDGTENCTDIDECVTLGTSACGPDSTCTNTNGSFNCTCIGDSCPDVNIGSTEIGFNDRTLEYFGIGAAILASIITAIILGWLIRRKRRRQTPLFEENPTDNPNVDTDGVTVEPLQQDVSAPVNASTEQTNPTEISPPTSQAMQQSDTTSGSAIGETTPPLPQASTSPSSTSIAGGSSSDAITPITSEAVSSTPNVLNTDVGHSADSETGRQSSLDMGQNVSDARSGVVPSPQSTSSSSALDATLPAIDEIEVWQGPTTLA